MFASSKILQVTRDQNGVTVTMSDVCLIQVMRYLPNVRQFSKIKGTDLCSLLSGNLAASPAISQHESQIQAERVKYTCLLISDKSRCLRTQQRTLFSGVL